MKVMKYVVVVCLVLVGCSKQAPPAPAAPTVSLSANPASVEHGQCATLTWSSTNASTVSIDQGVGQVDPSGSKEVCPLSSTQYTITAAGEGGSGEASTTVDVTALAAAVVIFPEAALFASGKSALKPEGKQKIEEYREQAKDQLSRADHVMITGYTDNVGGADHNSKLSQQRAEAVRDHLVSLGADPQTFQVSGAGEANPIADNSTEEGRAKNRRVEVAVVGAEK
jgi:outer membrane protein OmpA-like peptidoglycan-associated protein